MRLQLVALALVTIGHVSLSAHDMWIVPSTFTPGAGEIIPLRLRVGQDMLGDPLPRDAKLVREFIVEDAEGRKPVVGRDGGDPAGFVRAAVPGLLIVGYHSTPSVVDLTPEKFDQYIREEGLDAVGAERARQHKSATGARDMFTRCAKTLMLSGPPAASQRDRSLGCALELVAERNPYALRDGQDLPVRLTYLGRPIPGVLVVAMNRLNPTQKTSARTDADGRVHVKMRSSGMWLVKAVHMVPAPAGSGADWASYWASVTFGPDGPGSETR